MGAWNMLSNVGGGGGRYDDKKGMEEYGLFGGSLKWHYAQPR